MTNVIRLVGWPKRCNLSSSLPNSPKEVDLIWATLTTEPTDCQIGVEGLFDQASLASRQRSADWANHQGFDLSAVSCKALPFRMHSSLSISQSRFVCGKCIKKSITLFCRSNSQPTWCIIAFITFVMIIEPIWRPSRRLIAWFVDDRAIICRAGIAVSFL